MGNEIILTNDNFETEVEKSDKPVLVDFWAEWCMPCKMISPILKELSETYGDKLAIGKVNVDEQAELASKFNIVSIPTVILFHDGEIKKQQVGAAPKGTFESMFEEYI
jgi:thioredoxin 1